MLDQRDDTDINIKNINKIVFFSQSLNIEK